VLFDLGDTVLLQESYDPLAGVERLLELNRNPAVEREAVLADARDWFERLLEERRRCAPVEIAVRSFLRLFLEAHGMRVDAGPAEVELEFWKASSRMRPAPGIEAALDACTSRGLPVGMISNTMFSEPVLRWELAQHGLAGHFGCVIASSEYGYRKPWRGLFVAGAQRLGVPAEEVWFCGDSLENDVAGARGAGLVPVWYAPRGGGAGDAGDGDRARAGAVRVTDWNELARWLALDF
jgi:putative hydrolase of the HAD superfamily